MNYDKHYPGFSIVFFMKFVTLYSHKYFMYRGFWIFHKDHRIKAQQIQSFLEKNSLFFFIYAFTVLVLMITGIAEGSNSLSAIGTGIALSILNNVLIDDDFFHHCLHVKLNFRNGYFAALINAPEAHHFGNNVKYFNNYV